MNTLVTLGRIAIILVLLVSYNLSAQGQSPCNQGRAEDFGDVDPRNIGAICIPEVGRITGFPPPCAGEQFGNQIVPVGDVSGDGLADFLVARRRCDTVIPGGSFPHELLLYKGVPGGVPLSESGERIGPSEIASRTGYVAHGDFDGDGVIDIAVRIQLVPDTSAGNVTGYDISSLVVFWGGLGGVYSVADTTHLACEEQMWMFINRSVGVDLDADGTSDLCVFNTFGFSNGKPTRMPYLHVYLGKPGRRWGRGQTPDTADWVWWNSPSSDRVELLDHDGDGVVDVGFHTDQRAGTGFLSVLYGRLGELPDTTKFETVNLLIANGHASQFQDISGDGIPELLVTSGSENTIKVFIGLKGQRLKEQYGTGIDPPEPDSARWWGRPWCQLWLPKKINPNWFYDYYRLFDLGDANGDGYNDIYTISWPYMLCYTGGPYMDSLVDALVDIRPWGNIGGSALLGDIDGSGEPTMAIGNDGIRFLKPSAAIPSQWYQQRRFPQGTLVEVKDAMIEGRAKTLGLRAMPNPSDGDVLIEWQGGVMHGDAEITVSDLTGRRLTSFNVDGARGSVRWKADGISAGVYLITIQTATATAATQVVLQ